MDHPVGYFSQAVFRKKLNVAFGGSTLTGRTGYLTGLSIRAELQKEYRLPNHYVFVRPGTDPPRSRTICSGASSAFGACWTCLHDI